MTDGGYNKYTGNSDQPYPICQRCLEFIDLMKSKTEDGIKMVMNLAMVEAFDQGFKRGFITSDKEKEDVKKVGIQEGLYRATTAIEFLNKADNQTIYDIFRINPDITEYPFDYVLETWAMDYIVDCIDEYTKRHEVKSVKEVKPVKSKDISKAYDTGYADGLKEGEKLGIEECDNAIIYMTKNFITEDYVKMFGYTSLDYVLEEYSMSDIIDKVAQHITINETAEAQFNKLVTDIALKFNVPVETAKNIIKEYTSKDDDTKSTE